MVKQRALDAAFGGSNPSARDYQHPCTYVVARKLRTHSPHRELILSSQQAKKYLADSHRTELPTFLKKIGSNWVLQGRSVRWEAQKGWRAVRQRPKESVRFWVSTNELL